MISLSTDQVAALHRCTAALEAREETLLVGPAGCGKTTIMRELLRRTPWIPALAAPTGKASRRLGHLTGRPAQTLHKLMYARVDEINGELAFSEFKQALSPNHIIIVDEASMVDRDLYHELLAWKPRATRLLWVGDAEQLEPVKGVWGPDLTRPTARLTQVHRQALDNPIIACATAIREGRGDRWLGDWARKGRDERVLLTRGYLDVLNWYLANRDDEEVAVLTYTHKVRKWMNAQVRARLGFRKPICVGDRLLVRANNGPLDVMNGDVLRVLHVDENVNGRPDWLRIEVAGREDPLLVNLEFFERDPREFFAWKNTLGENDRELPFVHVWGGDVLTVHSSQGSQWRQVAFLWCNAFSRMRKKEPVSARRFFYTAVTRASENLIITAP